MRAVDRVAVEIGLRLLRFTRHGRTAAGASSAGVHQATTAAPRFSRRHASDEPNVASAIAGPIDGRIATVVTTATSDTAKSGVATAVPPPGANRSYPAADRRTETTTTATDGHAGG